MQHVALQQEDEGGGSDGMQADVAPVLHRTDTPRPGPRRSQCALARHVVSFSVVGPPTGAENWRSICGPGFGGLPEAKPSSTLPKFSLVRSSKLSWEISTIGA